MSQRYVTRLNVEPAEHRLVAKIHALSLGKEQLLRRATDETLSFALSIKRVPLFEPKLVRQDYITASSWEVARKRANKEVHDILGHQDNMFDYDVPDKLNERILGTVREFDRKNSTGDAEEHLRLLRDLADSVTYHTATEKMAAKKMFKNEKYPRAVVETIAFYAGSSARIMASLVFLGSLGVQVEHRLPLWEPWRVFEGGAIPMGYAKGRLMAYCRKPRLRE